MPAEYQNSGRAAQRRPPVSQGCRTGSRYARGVKFWRRPWQRIEVEHLVGAGLFFAVILLMKWAGDPGWMGLLDDANLVFHEAGHKLYGVFGETLALYGGVLGQLTFPAIVLGSALWKRQPIGVAIGGIWLFQNLPNIGRYMADARAQELPLVGGGEHDFWNIFTRGNVLDDDVVIGDRTTTLGWLGMFGILAWLGWRYWQQRKAAAA